MNDELNERRRSSDADGSAPPDRASAPMAGPDDHVETETLAGYLDRPGDLPHDERVGIDAHLAACASCRETLAELRAVVAAMSALPEVEPARSFALTPAMVGRREPTRPAVAARDAAAPIDMRQTSAWHARQMRAVRWATVAAAVLFVFVLSADIVSNRFVLDTRIDDEPIPVTARHEDAAGMTQAAEADEPEPPAAAQDGDDAAISADALRAADEEATVSEAPAAAEDPDQADRESADPEAQELAQYHEGASGEAAPAAADDDRRSMSTPQHYWRLAQVGLALLIVWLLAAMIALPRLGSGNRR